MRISDWSSDVCSSDLNVWQGIGWCQTKISRNTNRIDPSRRQGFYLALCSVSDSFYPDELARHRRQYAIAADGRPAHDFAEGASLRGPGFVPSKEKGAFGRAGRQTGRRGRKGEGW